jgi:oligopeptide/dipeptide ABC transporter ATP-binding protein
VRDLVVTIDAEDRTSRPVDGVSFAIAPGRTLGLVGESGCGKSLTALALLRLLPRPVARVERGTVELDGLDLLALDSRALRRVRGDRVAMVFQEPMTSLNPVFSCGEQIAETLRLHRGLSRRESTARAVELLAEVRIPEPARRARQYPHELSGGMRQRVMIAMAVACEPEVLVADEPTTALDVTVQAAILELLDQLQSRRGMAVLHITHDLAVIAERAHEVAVMYAGRIVEQAPVVALFAAPAHPYTLGLLASRPRLGARRDRLPAVPGRVPDPFARPPGCAFHPRCPFAKERCRHEDPVLEPVGGDADHRVACWESGHVQAAGRWPDAG